MNSRKAFTSELPRTAPGRTMKLPVLGKINTVKPKPSSKPKAGEQEIREIFPPNTNFRDAESANENDGKSQVEMTPEITGLAPNRSTFSRIKENRPESRKGTSCAPTKMAKSTKKSTPKKVKSKEKQSTENSIGNDKSENPPSLEPLFRKSQKFFESLTGAVSRLDNETRLAYKADVAEYLSQATSSGSEESSVSRFSELMVRQKSATAGTSTGAGQLQAIQEQQERDRLSIRRKLSKGSYSDLTESEKREYSKLLAEILLSRRWEKFKSSSMKFKEAKEDKMKSSNTVKIVTPDEKDKQEKEIPDFLPQLHMAEKAKSEKFGERKPTASNANAPKHSLPGTSRKPFSENPSKEVVRGTLERKVFGRPTVVEPILDIQAARCTQSSPLGPNRTQDSPKTEAKAKTKP